MLDRKLFQKEILKLQVCFPSHPIWKQKIDGKIIAYDFLYSMLEAWPDWIFQKAIKILIERTHLWQSENIFGELCEIRKDNERKWAEKEFMRINHKTSFADDEITDFMALSHAENPKLFHTVKSIGGDID